MIRAAAQPIVTARLALVPLGPEHSGEMATVLSDPGLFRFIGGGPPSPQALHARYEALAAGSGDPGVSWCNWVIRLTDPGCLAGDPGCLTGDGGWLSGERGRLTGTVQATITAAAGPLVAEVAWVVGRRWQGHGIATEAARALVGWLGQQAVQTVIAHIHPGHRASMGVAAAAGLTPRDRWQDGEREWRLTLAP